MTTLDFSRRYIKFDRASLITGAFDDSKYPHLRKPLAANDDIGIQTLVLYKSAGCMGTVFLQIVIAKHLACDVGDAYFVAQTDDDAATWGVSRGQGFILSVPDIWRLRRASIIERSCFTQSQWRFRHCDLYITGPGKTSRQSKQVRLVLTDESHLTDNYEEGAIKEFDDRRQRWGWGGRSVHATTAADSGVEIDRAYYAGRQNEYHWRCPHCSQLIWPLWREVTSSHRHAMDYYGKDVFLWHEKETDDATLDSIHVRCPHCSALFFDTYQDRLSLIGDDYVAMNPNAKRGHDSYRWSVFAIADIAWSDTFAKYREAVAAAKLGNLALLENFCKKQLCGSWTPTLPDFGDAKGNRDYRTGEAWGKADTIRFLTSDPQAGKAGEPAHRHALVTEWDRAGNSRRICYRRIDSAAQLHEMAVEFGVREGVHGAQWPCVMVDSGHEPRRTFRECAQFNWLAFRGSDLQQFHAIHDKQGRAITVPMPFSDPEAQSGIVGESVPNRTRAVKRGALPAGWAYCITGTNPELYGYLYALITGSSGRYFGIASDFPECYVKNQPAFIPQLEQDKKTATVKKIIWKKIREDHYHDLEVMAIVLAIRHGYFPISRLRENNETKNTNGN